MAYLIERKSQTIFVTATSIIAKGKPREMIVESRPNTQSFNSRACRKNSQCRGRKCTQLPNGGMRPISESKVRRFRSGSVPAGQKGSRLWAPDQLDCAFPLRLLRASSIRTTRSSARRCVYRLSICMLLWPLIADTS